MGHEIKSPDRPMYILRKYIYRHLREEEHKKECKKKSEGSHYSFDSDEEVYEDVVIESARDWLH